MCQREIHCLQYRMAAAATGVIMLLSKIDSCGRWTLPYQFTYWQWCCVLCEEPSVLQSCMHWSTDWAHEGMPNSMKVYFDKKKQRIEKCCLRSAGCTAHLPVILVDTVCTTQGDINRAMTISKCLNSPSRLHLSSTAIFLCIELDDRMTELIACSTTALHNEGFRLYTHCQNFHNFP